MDFGGLPANPEKAYGPPSCVPFRGWSSKAQNGRGCVPHFLLLLVGLHFLLAWSQSQFPPPFHSPIHAFPFSPIPAATFLSLWWPLGALCVLIWGYLSTGSLASAPHQPLSLLHVSNPNLFMPWVTRYLIYGWGGQHYPLQACLLTERVWWISLQA